MIIFCSFLQISQKLLQPSPTQLQRSPITNYRASLSHGHRNPPSPRRDSMPTFSLVAYSQKELDDAYAVLEAVKELSEDDQLQRTQDSPLVSRMLQAYLASSSPTSAPKSASPVLALGDLIRARRTASTMQRVSESQMRSRLAMVGGDFQTAPVRETEI